MIDEILFMETRLLRQFGEKFHIDHLKTNELFSKYHVWEYRILEMECFFFMEAIPQWNTSI